MRIAPLLIASTLATVTCLSAMAQTLSSPPIAPKHDVTNTYFGQVVHDPYRWMENLTDPDVLAWFKGQNDYARQTLQTIPNRDTFLARIRSLDNADTKINQVQIWGNRTFYLKMRPGDNSNKLYTRIGFTGPETLLFDPEKSGKNGVHDSIDYSAPSLDGKYILYGLSPGGSEQSVIHVALSATGKPLPDKIDRTRFGNITWLPDGHSFFYNRLPKLMVNASVTDGEQRSRIYRHVLGTDPERDKPIFGFGVSPQIPIEPSAIPFVQVTPASPFAYGVIQHGVQSEWTIYAAPLVNVLAGRANWRKVADVADAVTNFDAHGDTIYLLTHKGASRFKIVSTSASHPDIAHAATVVPASSVVIKSLGVARDALYIQDLDGGLSHIRRVAFTGGAAKLVPLPFIGSVTENFITPQQPGLLLKMTSWTKSPLWYVYDPGTNRVTNTHLRPVSPVDFSKITSVEVKVKAPDGAMIPLSIIYQKGLKLDGTHPTLLQGYGAYGAVQQPSFGPTGLAWLERGGISAVAHVRGGGAYGEDWHLAGYKATKANTWRDFIACAQYLIAKGYTSPAHLGGQGGSAGGIAIGRAITERPDLFGAALIDVGSVNTVRAELSPNGPPNIPEFGTATTKAGFQSLYAMDSYLHVVPGTKYPAVLLTTGIHDPRVASWEPGKMTAALQAATSSGKPVLLRVDFDAGHGLGSTRLQIDAQQADEFSFLLWQLGHPDFQPK